MALGDFFRINMPYGIKKNERGEWAAFNREYLPLGYIDQSKSHKFDELAVFVKYKNLTDNMLLKLADADTDSIYKNLEGDIIRVYFYSDATNPQSEPKHWPAYIEKLKLLSNLLTG